MNNPIPTLVTCKDRYAKVYDLIPKTRYPVLATKTCECKQRTLIDIGIKAERPVSHCPICMVTVKSENLLFDSRLFNPVK